MFDNKFIPKVSIIMATFNRLHFIEESLESIKGQSFKNWECIIIDDGSNDGTLSFVYLYVQNDSRFKFFKRSVEFAKGLSGCRNMGLKKASGDYLVFFDDDDIVHPDNLQICTNLLKGGENFYIRYNKNPFQSDSKDIEFNNIQTRSLHQFKTENLDKMIIGAIPFASCCVMWDAECFKEIRFNEELMYAEEWECYSRILSEGFEGLITNSVLYFNRKHPDSNTGQFYNKDFEKIKSKIKASRLIIENLASKQLYYPLLKLYFIRLGFQLNSKELIEKALQYSGAGLTEKTKYRLGFYFYPVLRPLFILKGKLLSR